MVQTLVTPLRTAFPTDRRAYMQRVVVGALPPTQLYRWRASSLNIADGLPVTAWASAGGTGTATFTASNGPTMRFDSAGRRYLEFDGVNDVMSGVPMLTDPVTVIVIGRARTAGAAAVFLSGNSTPGGHFLGTLTGATWNVNSGTTIGTRAADTSRHVLLGTFNGAGSVVGVDAYDEEIGNAGTNVGGTSLRVGANGAASVAYYPIDVYEILVISGTLTATERLQARVQLMADYSIS